MRTLLLTPGHFTHTYQNDVWGISAWAPGEEREVSEDAVAYLLATFPEIFVEISRAAEPSTPPAPSRRRERSGG